MSQGFRAVIVVPTIREESIRSFLKLWSDAFTGHTVIVVEDNPQRSFAISGEGIEHYSWEEIDADLGSDSWIIPRRTDCIRSYGYWKAYLKRPDMVVTLDDDCYPDGEAGTFLQQHWDHLSESGPSECWVSTTEGTKPRGVPYMNTARSWPCVLNHGLWNEIPDFDAPTQLLTARYPRAISWLDTTIPVGSYFPMCGMNLAFRPIVVPALYFLLMGQGYEYDRFGDIWAGIVVKRIADHLGYGVNSGRPAVRHARASNVWANLRKEAPGLEVNETFWDAVDQIRLTKLSFGECYKEVADGLKLEGEYWTKLKTAMSLWCELFLG